MKIHCFYSESKDIDSTDERKLICLWIESWRNKGFDPVVLNESWAERHPLFEAYRDKVSQFPSTNPAGYDLSCFLRWMAVAVAETEDTATMADYDVFNYGFAPLIAGNSKITAYQGHVPCLVSGRPKSFLGMCKLFMDFIPREGETHVSDMSILASLTPIQSDKIITFNHPIIKSYGEPGWDKSPAVHYPNGVMSPAKLTPRYEHIPRLRAQ